MKNLIVLTICVAFNYSPLLAQKTDVELSKLLDTNPYSRIKIDYEENKFMLSDSVKQKFLIALRGNLPTALRDSLFSLTLEQEQSFWKQSMYECKGDSVCTAQKYKNIIYGVLEHIKDAYSKQYIKRELILAAGAWNIKEAIPVLDSAIGNNRYDQWMIKMALAKFGNKQYLQEITDRYTLSYVLKHTRLDTLNNEAIYDIEVISSSLPISEGVWAAKYLKEKNILLGIVDMLYVKGIETYFFDMEDVFMPIVFYFVESFTSSYGNDEKLRKITENWIVEWSAWDGENSELRRETEERLTREYHAKIRQWVIDNVNFE